MNYSNGKQALTLLEKVQPTLIITDLMMPVMGGMALVEQVKTNPKWSEIPILVLTAKSSPIVKNKVLRIGVDDYLTKPFEEPTLKAQLNFL